MWSMVDSDSESWWRFIDEIDGYSMVEHDNDIGSDSFVTST